MRPLDSLNDSTLSAKKKDIKNIPAPKKNKTLYKIIGVVLGIIIITAIVLLAVLVPKKDKLIHKMNVDNRIANSKQILELLIEGNFQRRRNLKESEETIKIFGDTFKDLYR